MTRLMPTTTTTFATTRTLVRASWTRRTSHSNALGLARPGQPVLRRTPIAGVRAVVAVGSGKGGVGKTTVAVNVAASLARHCGLRVGVLDADVFGPSVPTMLGLRRFNDDSDLTTNANQVPNSNGNPNQEHHRSVDTGNDQVPVDPTTGKLIPLRSHGVAAMSIGLLVPSDRAVVWRGMMVAKALEQMLRDVDWTGTDVLVVDLPPGTGDVAITLAQMVPVAAAVLVTTPQDVALADTLRAANMFTKLRVPVAGVVQNMARLVCGCCGSSQTVFGPGRLRGTRAAAEKLGIDLLADIEISPAVAAAADAGVPVASAVHIPRFRNFDAIATEDDEHPARCGHQKEVGNIVDDSRNNIDPKSNNVPYSASLASLQRVDAQFAAIARNLADLLKLTPRKDT